jgi:hypothetical protein
MLTDTLLSNRVNHSNDILKYEKVIAVKGLALNLNFACSLKTEKSIVSKLRDTMKKLEQDGTFTTIRNKWKKQLVPTR